MCSFIDRCRNGKAINSATRKHAEGPIFGDILSLHARELFLASPEHVHTLAFPSQRRRERRLILNLIMNPKTE